MAKHAAAILETLAAVAPGTPLRSGLDRILDSGKGALIVVGDSSDVLSIASGGFHLDAAFSAQRLSEVAKMDGAIILSGDCTRIARANVHLVPDPDLPTSETGTRHRTAERVARSIGVPAISVSESRETITIYVGEWQQELYPPARLLARANQAIQTLERYRSRLDDGTAALSALEVEDLVTVRDVTSVLQRSEMVRRIAEELELVSIELGTDARLVRLQLQELVGGVLDERSSVLQDYVVSTGHWNLDEALEALDQLETDELLDPQVMSERLNLLVGANSSLDDAVDPRGYRLLGRLPRLHVATAARIVEHFGSLQKIMRATTDELAEVAGVDASMAKLVKDGLGRVAESSILDSVY